MGIWDAPWVYMLELYMYNDLLTTCTHLFFFSHVLTFHFVQIFSWNCSQFSSSIPCYIPKHHLYKKRGINNYNNSKGANVWEEELCGNHVSIALQCFQLREGNFVVLLLQLLFYHN